MKKILILLFLIGFLFFSNNTLAQSEKYLTNRVTIEGTYKRNLGNFSHVWANATGGYISYGIAFPEHNLLIFRSGFISHSLKDGVNYTDASSTVIPLHFGGRYYLIDERIMPFISFMNGLNFVFKNINLEGEKEDRILVKYAWHFGIGVSINVVSRIIFDISVNYNSDFYHTDTMMTAIEYTFGLGWRLSN